jgi:hypothetical protein
VPKLCCWRLHRANHPRLWRNILTNLKTITKTASELGKEAKESIEGLSRSAGKTLDVARDGTGDALHAAAVTVRTTGRKSSQALDKFATSTANGLDATASFVRDYDLKDMWNAVQKYSRKHVAVSLVAAIAVGFIFGTTLRRVTHS